MTDEPVQLPGLTPEMLRVLDVLAVMPYGVKAKSKGQLLEAKDNLQKMLANIPLTEDERAAVDDGNAAVDQLLARLADVPTPARPTPRQIGAPPTITHLPIVEVRPSPAR